MKRSAGRYASGRKVAPTYRVSDKVIFKDWRPYDDNLLTVMFNRGNSVSVIARSLGKTDADVAARVEYLSETMGAKND